MTGSRKPIRNLFGILGCTLVLASCLDENVQAPLKEPPPPEPQAAPLPTFDTDGKVEADIRWTSYGVPHVKADNLESMAFGVGYAAARDNLCIIMDQVVKFNSQRSLYFGPDKVPGSGDSEHLINDFGYLTIGIRELAETNLPNMSERTRALLQGYSNGINQYLSDTDTSNLDPTCAGMPWVGPIDSADLATFLLGVGVLPGAANFLGAMFVAAPPGADFRPTPMASGKTGELKIKPNVPLPQINDLELGSNGWGLGSDRTENGMGMVLGNPHFPHNGGLRFWQFHATIPEHMNVLGSSIVGMPGAVNIGFNENVAWTHTFSTAEHFVVYQLQLAEDDTTGLEYMLDSKPETITSKQFTIDVATGPGTSMKLQKTSYYSQWGPLVVVPGNFDWGPNDMAFAIKDVNLPNLDIVDHWLGMNLANSMDEFKQVFKDYDGVIFNNTMSASKDGQVFYIDDSTVPGLNSIAIDALTTNPVLIATREAAGFTVLPGTSTFFEFTGAVPYEDAPKYSGSDYVQNSNDSFWLTNVDNPITGVSPLYGKVDNQQSARSRMAHKLLNDAAGSDNKFSLAELEQGLLSNRSYLGESIHDQLVTICQARGSDPVPVDGEDIDISAGCSALANWDKRMNKDSVAAHLFREFAFYRWADPQWDVPFDVTDPLNTPNTLTDNDATVTQFARAVKNMQDAGIAMDATLGEVQFVERSTVDGQPTGEKLPWAGGHNADGSFNVFDARVRDNGTLIPRHTYATVPGSELSIEGKGYHINYGSSWMMTVSFTESGPQAKGLTTYSQSNVISSPHFLDQTELYSQSPQLRPLYFTESDIQANTIESMTVTAQ